jgi:ubiquinone/menaquinone biosynthesis C-methylase UbiE
MGGSVNERRFDPEKKNALTGVERQARWNPAGLLTRLGIRAGQTVLDLGCGPGFWTLPLAEIVGAEGAVWALDVSQEMLDALAERKPPAQVHLLRSELPYIDLPDRAVDWIWGAFVLHEVEPLEDMTAELRRVLRPGGHLAVLDWRPDAAHEDGPPRHHRLSPKMILQQLEAAGFEHLQQKWQHEDAYLIEARLREK